jgi:hypothetical protein
MSVWCAVLAVGCAAVRERSKGVLPGCNQDDSVFVAAKLKDKARTQARTQSARMEACEQCGRADMVTGRKATVVA